MTRPSWPDTAHWLLEPTAVHETELLLTTAHLDLMAVDEGAIPELHRVAMIPSVRRHWRTRGQYVPPEAWMNLLFSQSLFQCYAKESASGRIIGYSELIDANMLDGYAYFSTYSHPDVWNTGLPLEHALGTLALAFQQLPLRKVVAHVPEQNLGRLSDLHLISDMVGTLASHVLIAGEYRDVSIFEITREQFEGLLAHKFRSILNPEVGAGDAERFTAGDAGERDAHVSLEAALVLFDEWAESLPESGAVDVSTADLDSLHWLEVIDILETSIGRRLNPEALMATGSVSGIRLFLERDLSRSSRSVTRG